MGENFAGLCYMQLHLKSYIIKKKVLYFVLLLKNGKQKYIYIYMQDCKIQSEPRYQMSPVPIPVIWKINPCSLKTRSIYIILSLIRTQNKKEKNENSFLLSLSLSSPNLNSPRAFFFALLCFSASLDSHPGISVFCRLPRMKKQKTKTSTKPVGRRTSEYSQPFQKYRLSEIRMLVVPLLPGVQD